MGPARNPRKLLRSTDDMAGVVGDTAGSIDQRGWSRIPAHAAVDGAVRPERITRLDAFTLLPMLAIGVDLATPLLIWQGVLPPSIRWASHTAVAAMIVVSVLRMLAFGRIPRSFLAIVAISLIWSYVAIGNGQGILPTAWGLWLLFQFPLVGLFAYLQPVWPADFPDYVRKAVLWILALQVSVQLVQFATGVRPGDGLSGLFGQNGTGNAVIFSLLACCLFFGFWIESQRWKELILVLSLSVVSSVLGEMKLFPAAIALIALLAAVLYAATHRKPARTFLFVLLIAIVLISFLNLYNLLVPGAERDPLQSYITNSASLSRYLNRLAVYNVGGNIYADMGRDFAIQLGWNSLQRDPITALVGYGIGSRSESKSLGTAGVALTGGDLGWSVGTSLLVFMQEMGWLGLMTLSALILWIALSLIRGIRRDPASTALGVRYGMLLFTVLWPVWLYYAVTWTMRAPMLLYWLLVGYVFAEPRGRPDVQRSTPLLR